MYKIDRKPLQQEKKSLKFGLVVVLLVMIGLAYYIINTAFLGTETELQKDGIVFLIIIPLFLIIYIKLTLFSLELVDEKNQLYDYLALNGKLIRGLRYTVKIRSHKSNTYSYRIIAVYEDEKGEVFFLEGDTRHSDKLPSDKDFVDIIIHPNDVKKCYVDFDIEEI